MQNNGLCRFYTLRPTSLCGFQGRENQQPVNSSKFDRLLSSKGRAIQFQNRGNARNAFDQLRRDLDVSADDVIQRPGSVTTFRRGNRTFTLRSDSAGGNTVSVVTDNNPQQIVIRFGQE